LNLGHGTRCVVSLKRVVKRRRDALPHGKACATLRPRHRRCARVLVAPPGAQAEDCRQRQTGSPLSRLVESEQVRAGDDPRCERGAPQILLRLTGTRDVAEWVGRYPAVRLLHGRRPGRRCVVRRPFPGHIQGNSEDSTGQDRRVTWRDLRVVPGGDEDRWPVAGPGAAHREDVVKAAPRDSHLPNVLVSRLALTMSNTPWPCLVGDFAIDRRLHHRADGSFIGESSTTAPVRTMRTGSL